MCLQLIVQQRCFFYHCARADQILHDQVFLYGVVRGVAGRQTYQLNAAAAEQVRVKAARAVLYGGSDAQILECRIRRMQSLSSRVWKAG